jgi:Na+-driven multidrug efflux pump
LAVVTIFLAIRRASKKVLSTAIVTLIGISLFSLPYLLWALQWLKNYHMVILLAPTLSIVALLGGLWWMRKQPQPHE